MPCSIILWKNAAKASLVRRGCLGHVGHRPFRKEHRRHAAHRVDRYRRTGARESVCEAENERRRRYPPAFRKIPGLRSSSSAAMPAAIATGFPESVPAWYIDPNGATFRMISSFAPYAPTGNPAADDLAQARNVGKDPVHRLRAAGVDAEAGYNLVEDQQGPVFARQFP